MKDLNDELMRLARTLNALRTRLASHAPGGVPWATYGLLFHLVKEGPRRSGELAGCAQVDASTVSRQVDQLVRMGLVERRADPADGRATQLVATAAGRDVHARVRAARERMLSEVLADWDPKDVDRLTRLMARLNDDMSARLPDLLDAVVDDSDAATSELAQAAR